LAAFYPVVATARHHQNHPTKGETTVTYDDNAITFEGDEEPDAHRDTLLGQHFAGLSEESADAVRREMARREAAGLPAVPEMSWED
jgi:hypothetical protein